MTAEALAEFAGGLTGSDGWARHWTRRLLYTTGIETVAERVGAYWLIDAVASYQGTKLDQASDGFQIWTLRRDSDECRENGAILECWRDLPREGRPSTPPLVRQVIEYTDFPLVDRAWPGFKVYVEGSAAERVMMLPSER